MSNGHVEIITGNSPRMKEIVIEVIDEYKLRYEIGFMGRETGRILVNME